MNGKMPRPAQQPTRIRQQPRPALRFQRKAGRRRRIDTETRRRGDAEIAIISLSPGLLVSWSTISLSPGLLVSLSLIPLFPSPHLPLSGSPPLFKESLDALKQRLDQLAGLLVG